MGKDMANRMDELRSKHSKTLETITRQTLERFESEECIEKEISEVREYVVRARSARLLIMSLASYARTSLSEVFEYQLTRVTYIIRALITQT